MKINQDTVNGIIENAKMANEGIYKKLCLDANFKERFHLRPKRNEITIVSTLSAAPMWGLSVEKGQLESTLEKLKNNFNTICSVTRKTVLKGLKEVGYDVEREIDPPDSEAAVQAKFIQGLLVGQSDYEDIKFVASELTLGKESRFAEGKEKRFDVVGIRGGILYIFELKKDRTTKAMKQVADYVKLVESNKPAFIKILSAYPNCDCVIDNFAVKGIAVMEYAANATNELKKEAENNKVDLWFYKQALSFEKVKKSK